MLALRPGCECWDRDLPPDSDQAMICTFECTFCRPRRPAALLAKYPASTERVFEPDGCGRAAG
jgi:hypothetical protein